MDLVRCDAWDLVNLFRTGRATPVDVFEASAAQMRRLEPLLNAMTAINPRARQEAEASARRWRDGEALGPIDGVPVTLKDNLVAAGMPASFGSSAFRGFVPEEDEVPVARARQAGAVVLGKTNLPEFALEGYTDNALFGATGNPLDPALTPGGSTGGGAASVAAHYAPVALGTDGGGSLRRPAAHCGLFGFKSSIGRVPRHGGLPQLLLDFEVAGALTRSMRDIRTMHDVLAGPDPRVPASWAVPDPPPPGRPLRILAVERFGTAPVDPAIVPAYRAFVDRLEAVGHWVEHGVLPLRVEPIAEIWPDIGRAHLAWLFAERPEVAAAASPKYRAMAEEGSRLPATSMLAILDRVAVLRHGAADLFRQVNAVVTPAIAALAWPKHLSHPEEIDGQPVGPRGHSVYTGWVNAAGLPGLALPTAPAPDGRTTGVQIVGGWGADRLLLELGSSLFP